LHFTHTIIFLDQLPEIPKQGYTILSIFILSKRVLNKSIDGLFLKWHGGTGRGKGEMG